MLSEEIDLDYRLSEDGCTIVPLKKGEKLPDTRHGNEYELIAYHVAYYSSRAPKKEFFETEWQKIQAQVTQGVAAKEWIDWYKEAGVAELPSQEQLDLLYQRLLEPSSWPQRFRLLTDSTVEKMKLFRKQIRCNIQDPLDEEGVILGGASGTVNFYSLLQGIKEDPSVSSRIVSGGLDLDLALSHIQGLKAAAKIFDGKGKESGNKALLEAAKDPLCNRSSIKGALSKG